MKVIGRKEIEEFSRGGVFRASGDMIITPLARDWARENNVEIEETDKEVFTRIKNEVKSRNPQASEEDIKMAYMEVLAEETRKSEDPGYFHRQTIAKEERAVISVMGKNSVGIVAKLTECIAREGGNLLDLQQKIVGDFFTLVIIVDISGLGSDFAAFRKKVLDKSRDVGVDTKIIHEGVLHAMHRI